MFFAGFVVEQRAFLQGVTDDVVGNCGGICPGLLCQSSSDFQHVVSAARVSAGVAGDFFQDVVGGVQSHRAEAAVFIGEGPLEELDDLIFGERAQHIDTRAREQRAIDFERRILGWSLRSGECCLFPHEEEMHLVALC